VGLALVVGMVGLAVLVGGAVLTPQASGVWLALSLSMPAVLLQDVLRYVFICRKLSGFAFLLDAVWAVLSIGAMLILAATGFGTVAIIAAWIGGALVAAVLGLVLTRAVPQPIAGIRWFVANRDLSIRFSAEYASLNASTALVWFGLAGPLGSVGVAALRGASLLFSPLNTAFNAVRIAMIPELVRLRGSQRYRRGLLETGAILGGLAVVWGLVVLFLPDSAGRLLLGATWDEAKGLRLPNFVQSLAMVGYTVLLSYFRSSSLHSLSSRMRAVLAALTLALPLAAAVLFGVQGSAWGFAVAVGVACLSGLVLVRRSGPGPEAGGAVR
jgi:O-antigen/teichoic acid export membrane protein